MALTSFAVDLTTGNQDIVVAAASTEGSVHGLVFSNKSAAERTISIHHYKSNTDTTTIYSKKIAAYDVYSWPKPINMEPGDKIGASADVGAAVSCAASYFYEDATSGGVLVGWNPRGVYAAGTTYNINDVAFYSSMTPGKTGAYASRVNGNVGNTPDTNPADWMQLTAVPSDDDWVTVSYAATFAPDFSVSESLEIILAGNIQIDPPTNAQRGKVYAIMLKQPASGGPYTGVWNATAYDFGSLGVPDLSEPADAVDIFYLHCLSDGVSPKFRVSFTQAAA